MKEIGLSNQKIKYIKELSIFFQKKKLILKHYQMMKSTIN